MDHSFTNLLAAPGPHESLGAHAKTYGRVIGSWKGELHNHMFGAPARTSSIEVSFGWVLEGRAVEDVWITPARGERSPPSPSNFNWYGSTLRVFDPARQSWRAVWTDPASQLHIELEGRSIGEDVVQLGTRDGQPIRWTFSDIRDDSFTWRAHILEPDGVNFRLEVEINLRRVR